MPTLTLTPSSVNLSRSVVDTSWEGVCDFDYGATLKDGTHTLKVTTANTKIASTSMAN